ncbi:MAG: type II secretion system protein [Candidatus Gottesmanbacteria bacterium]
MVKNPARVLGFTIIELVFVIAMIGIFAVAIIVLINPIKRINQARDSKVKSDISQIATGLQNYFVLNSLFPTSPETTLVTSGDLRTYPIPPEGGSYIYSRSNVCVAGACEASIYGTLKDPSISGSGNVWCWRSATGKMIELSLSSCTP